MKIANNNINGVFVKRQIVETVEQPTQYEMPEGLPFYYYMGSFLPYIVIAVGIALFFISIIGSGFFYYFILFRKKYRCPKCNHTFSCKKDETPVCPKCGIELPLN